ncbi:MAG: SET domain-containing protein [Chloroflexi bacterium]|nr:SET domain-containing protein [Chloroflexota bacterium]
MYHPSVKLTETSEIEGKGLVVESFIARGEVVWWPNPDEKPIPLAEIKAWPEEKQQEFERYGFQCGEAEFILAQGIDRYMNHSCDPNTWWDGEYRLVARRDIQPGEEITYDYATADILLEFQMPCNCGSPMRQ